MKLSLFKIGLIVSVIGVVWISFTFSEGEKISQTVNLNIAQTKSLDLELQNAGVGFYKITLPELRNTVFVQILDSDLNVVVDKKIETRQAVNYFEISDAGIHTIKVTNLSENPISVDIEFGNTNSKEMLIPRILLFGGVIMIIIASVIRLKNYKMAQPDENIS